MPHLGGLGFRAMPDVAIVGGGIIGAACAHELARRGASVVLIERDELAAGASGRNQGWFILSADPPCAPMSRVSLSVYLDVVDTSALTVWFDRDPIGFLLVATDERGVSAARTHAVEWEAIGVTAEMLDATDLRDAEPALAEDVIAGWLLDEGRRVDPGALTVALATAARHLGADIRHHVNVRSLTHVGGRVTGVASDDGIIAADTVIVAAGPWSAPLVRPLGVGLPVTGARGWIVELASTPGLLRHLIEEEDGVPEEAERFPSAAGLAGGITPEPAVASIVHAAPDGTVVCGASHHPVVRPEAEDPGAPSRIAARAIRLVPALAGLTVRGTRWGIRPMSPDGRPLVGWLADGLFAATGHGPEGVLLGGGTAALAGALIQGEEPPFEAAPFDPHRF
jgi:glycine/D-amino acid oxidase-like deaminating enzyme